MFEEEEETEEEKEGMRLEGRVGLEGEREEGGEGQGMCEGQDPGGGTLEDLCECDGEVALETGVCGRWRETWKPGGASRREKRREMSAREERMVELAGSAGSDLKATWRVWE